MAKTLQQSPNGSFKDSERVIHRLGLAHTSRPDQSPVADVAMLLQAVRSTDHVTSGHALRVQRRVLLMCDVLGAIRDDDQFTIETAAMLHDIGKLAIENDILEKPGPLTPSETERVRMHAAIGCEVIQQLTGATEVAKTVLHHHEWWDGRGYPCGARTHDIPLGSRLIAVADAFDAMISDRPYRSAMSPGEAYDELQRCAGVQFDTDVVEIFAASGAISGRTAVDPRPTDG